MKFEQGSFTIECGDFPRSTFLSIEKRGKTPEEALKITAMKEEGRDMLGDLTDTAECRLDHHGYCQSHNFLESGTCANKRGVELWKRLKEALNGKR